jgi:hypothetical protein
MLVYNIGKRKGGGGGGLNKYPRGHAGGLLQKIKKYGSRLAANGVTFVQRMKYAFINVCNSYLKHFLMWCISNKLQERKCSSFCALYFLHFWCFVNIKFVYTVITRVSRQWDMYNCRECTQRIWTSTKKTKLRGLSPRANCTEQAAWISALNV